MRIGVMLRSVDETGGIGVYARNIVEELLKIDRKNKYLLFYRNKDNIGSYSKYHNTKEIHINAQNKALWDQVAIPRIAKKEGVDLIFHPKFTVPLLTKSKTIMVVHGADWFLPPYHKVFSKLDVTYIKAFMPLYLKKADFVISVSDFSRAGFIKAFPNCKNKIRTIYFAPNKVFRKIEDTDFLKKVGNKYRLPNRFILTVIRYDPGTPNKRKNFGKMIEAFSIFKKEVNTPHKLVVVGKNCHKYCKDYGIEDSGLHQDIIFTGLVPQAELPAFYNLADLYLYPTIIEAFPIPITEAMSCGCPIVTSNGTGLKELAGEAALLVDPKNTREIADAIQRLLNDDVLRKTLIRRGLKRAKIFNWGKCARETLSIIETVAS